MALHNGEYITRRTIRKAMFINKDGNGALRQRAGGGFESISLGQGRFTKHTTAMFGIVWEASWE